MAEPTNFFDFVRFVIFATLFERPFFLKIINFCDRLSHCKKCRIFAAEISCITKISFVMKKLFTFLMAMVITTMVFGQFTKTYYPLDQPILATQDDRTGWIGGTDDFEYYYDMEENEKVAMRLPAAGELPSGNLIVTKVGFGWQATTPTTPTCNPNFRILIYAGGNGAWIHPETCPTDGDSYTTDTTVQGNLLYSQTYECTTGGWQTVELNDPVELPANQEIWIAVQALGTSCCWVCPDFEKQHPEWWGQHVLYKYNDPDEPTPENPTGYCWRTAAFVNPETGIRDPGKFALRVLIDNGEEYVYTNNWDADIYSPDTEESQTDITYLYVDEFMMMDSLYLSPALWNMGPDTSNEDGWLRFYVENSEVVFVDTLLSALVRDISVTSGRGWIFNWWGGLMAYEDMEELGLSFPFVVCLSFEPYGYDPNLSNNTACAQITDIDLGVSEKSNTLNISPNPANTYIKVENAAGARITVYNIAGQEVLSVASAEANETLDVSNLNAGLYIVRVANGNEVSTAKVSIVR